MARTPGRHRSPSVFQRHARQFAAVAAIGLTAGYVVLAAPTARANATGDNIYPNLTGGLQVDGDFAAATYNGVNLPGSLDWNSPAFAPQPLGKDPIGNADTTVLSTGSKESDYASWQTNGSSGSTPKGDIGNYYFHAAIFNLPAAPVHPGPHLLTYIGVERLGDTGTVDYAVELNQNTTTHPSDFAVTLPDRTPGDLRLKLFSKGNNGLTIAGTSSIWQCTDLSDVYPGPETSCNWSAEKDIPADAINGLVNDGTIADPFPSDIAGKQGGNLTANQFVEVGIDLTGLASGHEVIPGCPPSITFGQFNLRSRASEAITSEMKDIITPKLIGIPSLCADVRIEKQDPQGNLVPGATFTITPNPNTGLGSLIATDGGANDLTLQGTQAPEDGVIEFLNAIPGVYTVVETVPPAGWIGDPTPQTKTALPTVLTPFVIVNRLGSLVWQKVDADTGAKICCATFVVHRTAGLGTQADVTVTDNGPADLDPADGVIKIDGLKVGSYTITETVAPANYNLGADVTQTFDINAEVPDVTLETPFQDPLKVGYLRIVKKLVDTDGTPFAPKPDLSVLNGLNFEVYQDANDNGVLDAGEEAHVWPNPPSDSTDLAKCTISGGLGYCDIGPLPLGNYRVAELLPPPWMTSSGDVNVTVTETSADEPTVVNYTNSLKALKIGLSKTGPALAHVGDTITYGFAVTNTGPVDLVDAVLTDPKCDTGSIVQTGFGDNDPLKIFAINEVWNFTCTRVIQASDPDPLPNTATVTGHDNQGRDVTATADHSVDIIHPAISIVKTANDTKPAIGDTVTFSYEVTNTGDTTLFNVVVTDDILGAIGTIPQLAAGESKTLEASEVAADNTPPTNVATASGTDVLQKKVTATDDETIEVQTNNPPPPTPTTSTPRPTPTTTTNNPPPPTPTPPITGAAVGTPMKWALVLLLTGGLAIVASRTGRGRGKYASGGRRH